MTTEANTNSIKPIAFHIVHNKTGDIVGKAKTRARALQSADKRDNEYGAHAYSVVAVYSKKDI